MAVQLKEYELVIGGIPHTMLLSEEDAKARGVYADATPGADVKAEPQVKAKTK